MLWKIDKLWNTLYRLFLVNVFNCCFRDSGTALYPLYPLSLLWNMQRLSWPFYNRSLFSCYRVECNKKSKILKLVGLVKSERLECLQSVSVVTEAFNRHRGLPVPLNGRSDICRKLGWPRRWKVCSASVREWHVLFCFIFN